MRNYYTEIQQYIEKFGQGILVLDKKGIKINSETLSLLELLLIKGLGQNQTNTMPLIMEELGVDRNTFSSMLKKLQLQKCVVKRRSKEDGRVSVLELTQKGELLFQQIMDQEKELLAGILCDFTYNEERAILKFLVKLDMLRKSYK